MKKIIIFLLITSGVFSANAQTKINRDSLRTAVKLQWAKLQARDSVWAIVSYVDKDGLDKTDTCSIYLKATTANVYEYYGQELPPYAILINSNYYVFPNWSISKIYRDRNGKSLNKSRPYKIVIIE
jgi:hypothetical protein